MDHRVLQIGEDPNQQYYVYVKNPSGGTGFSQVQLTYKAEEK